MTPPKKHENSLYDSFHQAEQVINETIAGMDSETHIEYASTMERRSSQPNWWNRLLRRLQLRE